MVPVPGAREVQSEQVGAAVGGRHPNREFAARRMHEQEDARAARQAVRRCVDGASSARIVAGIPV